MFPSHVVTHQFSQVGWPAPSKTRKLFSFSSTSYVMKILEYLFRHVLRPLRCGGIYVDLKS